MRKIFKLLALGLAAVAACASCGKEEAAPTEQKIEQMIVGSWQADYFVAKTIKDGKVVDTERYDYAPTRLTETFNADNTYSEYNFFPANPDDPASIDIEYSNYGTYSVSGQDVTVVYQDQKPGQGPYGHTIRSIDKKYMVVIVYSDTEGPDSTTKEYYYYWKRQ